MVVRYECMAGEEAVMHAHMGVPGSKCISAWDEGDGLELQCMHMGFFLQTGVPG